MLAPAEQPGRELTAAQAIAAPRRRRSPRAVFRPPWLHSKRDCVPAYRQTGLWRRFLRALIAARRLGGRPVESGRRPGVPRGGGRRRSTAVEERRRSAPPRRTSAVARVELRRFNLSVNGLDFCLSVVNKYQHRPNMAGALGGRRDSGDGSGKVEETVRKRRRVRRRPFRVRDQSVDARRVGGNSSRSALPFVRAANQRGFAGETPRHPCDVVRRRVVAQAAAGDDFIRRSSPTPIGNIHAHREPIGRFGGPASSSAR